MCSNVTNRYIYQMGVLLIRAVVKPPVSFVFYGSTY